MGKGGGKFSQEGRRHAVKEVDTMHFIFIVRLQKHEVPSGHENISTRNLQESKSSRLFRLRPKEQRSRKGAASAQFLQKICSFGVNLAIF